MKKIDWSKAPKEATHCNYFPDGALLWYNVWGDGPDQFYFKETCDSGWREGAGRPINESKLIPRPDQWRGPEDGFPPDGLHCEALILAESFQSSRWVTGFAGIKMQAPNCGVGCNFKCEDGSLHFIGSISNFRPIQSERDKTIDSMVDDLNGMIDADQATLIYDAGYRKQLSRKEANEALTAGAAKAGMKISSLKLRSEILDALGYTEQ